MKKKLFYVTLIIAVLCVISIFICDWTIRKNAAPRTCTEISDIPVNNVGLLLGTSSKLKSGNNDLYFDYHIDAAVELYKAGKISYILISGNNRRENHNELEKVKKALMRKGVPKKSIYLDYAGFRIPDSVIRTKEISGQIRLTIISRRFHNEWTIYPAEKNGITAISFNARDVDIYTGLKTNIGELFARIKMFIDLAIDKQPHSLGEKHKLPSDK